MFLSRFEIPWDLARNPYHFHQRLWRLFPDDDQRQRTFLFRIEQHRAGLPFRGLLQSRRAPSQAERISLLGTREFSPQPQLGQRLAFVLTANPIKTIVDAEKSAKPGKQSEKCRVPLIKEEEQKAWLGRKFGGAASVEAVTVQPNPPLYFRKGHRGGKLAPVSFEGVLQVADPRLLVELLANGVGPAKAFGCGLMLVRRI